MRHRLVNAGIFGGVCAAFAYETGIPAPVVRFVVAFLGIATVLGWLLYVQRWVDDYAEYDTPNDYWERATLCGRVASIFGRT